MKPIFLAPRYQVRTMTPGPDVDRMLASGSWVQVPEHMMRPPTPEAIRQRRCRARKRDKVTNSATTGHTHTDTSAMNAPQTAADTYPMASPTGDSGQLSPLEHGGKRPDKCPAKARR